MSIDRLRYFAAVVETRNIRKAADLVGISPPSMSKAISVLESELGHKLLHADGRGIGITEKGLEIYRSSLSLLDENRRFYERLQTPGRDRKQLRIASFEVFSSYFLSTFFKAEKDFDVLLLEKSPGEIESALLAGTVDVGITYVPSPHSSIEYVEIGSFPMGIFGQKKWDDQTFEEWPFAIPTTELQIYSSDIQSLDMWPKSAPRRLVKYRFELLETALQTARDGISVLHCPTFIAKLQNAAVKSSHQLVPLKTPPGYKTVKAKAYLAVRKGYDVKPLEGKFAKFMRSL